jgi:hypothetical protein
VFSISFNGVTRKVALVVTGSDNALQDIRTLYTFVSQNFSKQ